MSRALVYAQWLSAHYSGWFMLYSQGFIQTIQDRDPFFDRETLGAIGVSCDRYASNSSPHSKGKHGYNARRLPYTSTFPDRLNDRAEKKR